MEAQLPRTNPTKSNNIISTTPYTAPQSEAFTSAFPIFNGNRITAENLKVFLDANFHSGAKICYVDCQSKKENAGYQIRGAIHMNLSAAPQAETVFNSYVKPQKMIMDALAAADVIIVYCQYAAARSPATCMVINRAMAERPDRNKDQKVLLLKGGIGAYVPVDPGRVTTWLAPAQGANLIKMSQCGSKDTAPVPQSYGEDNDNNSVLYTEQ